MEGLWFTGDEVAMVEGFRVIVEEAATGTNSLREEGAKLPGVTGSALVGRGTREPMCSRRSTGVPRRRGLGRPREPGLCSLGKVAREVLEVAAMLSEGC